MIEKNSDVDRAIAAVGGTHLSYHSFGPFVLRPRTTGLARPFIYNEFGEPEYAPALPQAPLQLAPAAAPPTMPAADPLYDTLPVVQPPVNRPSFAAPPPPPPPQPQPQPRPAARPAPPQAAPSRPVHAASAHEASAHEAAVYAQAYPPDAYAPAARPAAPPPQPASAPPPPPFFPLLAAALPNATEPTYAPQYPSAPAHAFQASPGQVAPAGQAASQDHRSLAEMFSLLAGRAVASPNGVAAPASSGLASPPAAPAEGQALFRRI